MFWSEHAPLFAGIMLVVVTIAGIGVSLWRVTQGGPGQRARGCMSLVLIGAGLILVIWVSIIMWQVGGHLAGPGDIPTQSAPGPSFATPAGGGALP